MAKTPPIGKLVFFREITATNNNPEQYKPFADLTGKFSEFGRRFIYAEMDDPYHQSKDYSFDSAGGFGPPEGANVKNIGGYPNLLVVGNTDGIMRNRMALYKLQAAGSSMSSLSSEYNDKFIQWIPTNGYLTSQISKWIPADPPIKESLMNNKNKLIILQGGYNSSKEAPANITEAIWAIDDWMKQDAGELPQSWCVYQGAFAAKYTDPANNYKWTMENNGWTKGHDVGLRLINDSTGARSIGGLSDELAYIFPFANHNFSIARPLCTSVNAPNPYEKYGFDSEISIKSVYNYYNKQYEDFYHGNWAKPLADSKHPGITTYGNVSSIVLPGLDEKLMPSFYLTFLLHNALRDYDQYNFFMSKYFGAKKDKGVNLQDAIDSLIKLYKAPATPGQGVAKYLLYDEVHPGKERTSVMAITPDFYRRYQADIEGLKKFFPFYNEINIPTLNYNNVFRTILQERGMFDDIQYLVSGMVKIINKIFLRDIQMGTAAAGGNKYTALGASFWEGLYADYDCYGLLPKSMDEDDPNAAMASSEWIHIGNPIPLQEYNFFNINWSRDVATIKLKKENYYSTQTMTQIPDIAKGPKSPHEPLMKSENMFYDSMYNYTPFISDMMLGTTNLSEMWKPGSKKAMSVTEPWYNDGPLMFYNKEKKTQSILPSLSGIKFLKLLEKLTEALKLDVKKVFNNKENYSEILFFEIQKFISEPVNTGKNKIPGFSNSKKLSDEDYSGLIQTFVLPNDPDRDVVSYIDSQVRMKKTYYYRIYAHTVTVGNVLRREKFIDATKKYEQHWEYLNLPDIKVARVPYYNINGFDVDKTKSVTVISQPPLPPEVTTFSFKDTPDKIGFWFNLNPGEVRRTVNDEILNFSFDGNLQSARASFFKKQKEKDPENKMTYRTDDYGGDIEIYRTTTRPTGYWPDFKDKKIATIPVVGSKAYISDVKPNQDYYYTFKMIDVHGYPSFPTVVHHFRIDTSNDVPEATSVRVGVDSSRPVLFHKIIDLSKNIEQKKTTREFKKYLLIEPNLDQTFLNFATFAGQNIKTASNVWHQENDKGDSIKLEFGDPEKKDKLFGKKFKIRITSKQTGKKMDINLDFKQPEIKEKTGK